MKVNSGYVISGVALIILALVFFTPIGDLAVKKLNKITLGGPSVELPNREFNLNDDNLDIDLTGFNGTADSNLKEHRGKVVFLNMWGSWCPPCVEEMPSIQKLYEAKGDQVSFVLITMQDKAERFVPFLEKHNYSMPVYEANSLLPKALIPNAFPTTFIINKKGEVVEKVTRSRNWNEEEVHKMLDKLLAE